MTEYNLPIWLVLLVLTIFSFIVAYISAKIDARQIRIKWGTIVSLNHTSRTIIRLSVFSLISFLIFTNIWNYILYIAYQWFMFSFYFDIILNNLRGYSYWYIGKTAKTDILIRKYLGEESGEKYALMKLMTCIFISIGIMILQ